jgi:hypothetical protein
MLSFGKGFQSFQIFQSEFFEKFVDFCSSFFYNKSNKRKEKPVAMTDEERGESLVGIPAKSSEKAPVRIASEERSTFSEALLLVNRVFRNEQASGSRNREREKLPGVELRTNGFLGEAGKLAAASGCRAIA